jgi:hypothetical protein
MKAKIFLDYHRYYQELKGNAIKSKYPTQKKEGGHNPSTLPPISAFQLQCINSLPHHTHRVRVSFEEDGSPITVHHNSKGFFYQRKNNLPS